MSNSLNTYDLIKRGLNAAAVRSETIANNIANVNTSGYKAFKVVFEEKDKDGYFAFVPELKGCVSQGNSFEEAKANIKEAIELYIESIEEEDLNLLLFKDYAIAPIEVSLER